MTSVSKVNYNPEDLLLTTLNDLEIGFVKVSNDGTILNHNLSFNKIFGYNPKEDLIGTKILDYWLNSEERNNFRKALYKDGIVKKYNAPVKKLDGEKILLQINIKLNKNSNGDIISSEGTFVDVSEECKEAELKLKESEEKYRSLFDNMHEGFAYCKIITDENNIPVDFLYLEINDAFERLTGLKKEETVGRRVTEVIPGIEDSEPNLFEIYGKVALTGENTKFEIFFEPLKIWLSISVYSREKNYFVAVFDNITEQKQGEQKLQESEENFRTITEQSLMGICIVQDDVIKFANQRMTDISGYSLDEIMNWQPTEFYKIIATESLDFVSEQAKKKQLGLPDVIPQYTLQIIKKSGEKIWIENLSKTINYNEKTADLVTLSEITDKVEAEQKLKESEEKFRGFLDFGNIGMAITSIDKSWVYCNDQICEILGFTRGELFDKTWADLSHPEDLQSDIEQFNKILDGKIESYQIEKRYIKKNGKIVYTHLTVSCIRNSDGTVKHFLATLQNITKRKKAEKKIENLARFPSENPNPILRIDKKKILYINQAGKILFDISTGDLIPNALKADMEKSFETDTISSLEVTMNERVYLFDITPVKDEEYMNIYGREITTRKKVEEEIIDEKNKLQTVMDTIQSGLSVQDLDYNILYHNHVATDLFGDCVGKKCYKIYEGNEKICPECPVELAFKDGKSHTIIRELKIPHSGEISYWENVANPIRNSEGKIVSCLEIATNITERMESEKKIKESESLIRKTQEIGKIGSFQMDLSTNNVIWSDQVYKLFDLKKEGNYIDYEKVVTLIHPDDRERAIKVSSEAIKEQKPYILEHRVIHPEGKILNLLIIGDVIRNEKNEVVKIGGIIQDITERKEAEQKLKESEEKWRALSESSPAHIMLLDGEHKILSINRTAPDLSKEEVIGTSVHAFTPEKFHKIERDSLNSVWETGKPVTYSTNYITKEGDTRFFDVWVGPVFQSDKIIALVSHSMDVTEKKAAELKLKESEEKYNNLFQYSNDAILLHDSEGNILEVNDRASELFKYPKEEILALTTPMLRTSEEQERREALNEEFSKKTFLKFEFNLKKKDGTIFPGEVSSRVIEIKGKKVIQALIRDVSERKMVEQKLREVNKLKSEFLRRASHELKTPLISIKGFSDLILALYVDQLDPDIISKLREINDGCERLQNIINNLLKTSRLESPDLKPKLQKEDLSFLIKFGVHELESLAEGRNQSIELDIDNDLYANIEKEEIHDVISNLLTNAIKYTPPMGKIEVKTELKEEFVVISIKDNGIGFTNEQKKIIFKQFGKIERYGQGLDLGIDGTGLGLYISKRIVDSHGGKIWMESEGKSKGSTFFFTLPIAKEQ